MDELTANVEGDLLRPLWTPALDPLFWPAARVGVESAWTAHVPFAHWLVATHRPAMIVELGTHNGVSYSAFCEAVQRTKLDCRCLAIDTWRGDEHAGHYGEEVYANLRRFHDARYAGFSELVRSTFDEARDYVPDGAIDLLHIDGLHTYDAVRHDLEAWRPKLSPRAVVLLHDTNVRQREFGVWRLLAQLSGEYPSFEFLHGHGLGLVLVGPDLGVSLRALTQLSPEAASAVRARFATLGERWEAEMRIDQEVARVRGDTGAYVEARESQWRAEVDRVRTDAEAQTQAALERAHAEAERQAEARHAQWRAEVDANHRNEIEQARTDAEQARAEQARQAEAHAAEQAAHDATRARLGQVEAAWRETAEAERQARLELASSRSELAAIRREAAQARAAALAAHVEIGASRAEAEKAREAAAAAIADAGRAREQAESAHAALHQAQSEAARARAEAHTLQRAEAAARHEAEHARHHAKLAHAEASALRSSTMWRATKPIRGAIRAIPAPVGRTLRGGPRLLWWALRLQLPSRLRERSTIAARAGLIESSPLFDPGWYLATNPDVAVSGIAPALHYAMSGGGEARDPGPQFSAARYLERHPEAAAEPGGPFLHALANGFEEDGRPLPALAAPEHAADPAYADPAGTPGAATHVAPAAPPAEPSPATPEQLPSLDAVFAVHWPHLAPLPVYAAPHYRRRVTIVTDSVNSGQLYGGVGTALILGVLTAKRLDADLRLVTRSERADTANIEAVLGVHGVHWTENIDCLFAPRTGAPGGRDVPASERDLFLTTSWWSSWAVRQSVPKRQITYLLQEDERMFYPLGDDHLRCSELLADPDLFAVVNSRLLLDHLQAGGVARNAVAFEPAFPESAYYPAHDHVGGKRRFFFYGRPNNGRNLYWRGVEAIRAAIEDGVIDPAEWDFFFCGKDMTRMFLPGGAVPQFLENLPWPEYAALVRTVDVGLSLMYTPHPSYPPLDLAASGAVVVTNRFGLKQSLDAYSENIICADPTVPGLVAALRDAVKLAGSEARSARFARNGLARDWHEALAPAVDAIAARTEA